MCSILNGTSSNPVVKTVIDVLKESIPASVHPCPYFGKLGMYNVTLDSTKFPSILPSGTYRSRIIYYDDTDPKMMTLLTHITCKSSIKSSF